MAQISRRKLCAKTIEFVKKKINSQSFIKRNKKKASDFTRRGILTFPVLLLFQINSLRTSNQNELDIFFKKINNSDVPKRVVTDAAFSIARKKVRYQVFHELNRETVAHFYEHYEAEKWHGFYLLAIDGSTVNAPNTPECRRHFGVSKNQHLEAEDERAMAKVSHCFDVLNSVTRDSLIRSSHTGEREMAEKHCESLGDTDLILLDRGYPGTRLFKLIEKRGAHFCARVPVRQWAVTREFYASGQKEQVAALPVTPSARKKHLDAGVDTEPLRIRLLRVELESGEPEILVTSLLDEEKFPHELFKELYFMRWPIEEHYKQLKYRIEIEAYTGESIQTTKQDFYARIFMSTLTAILAFPVHKKVEEDSRDKDLDYKINWTQALAKIRDCGIIMFFREHLPEIIGEIHKLFRENVSAIRKGRSFERKKNYSKRKIYPRYKPIS